MMVFDSKGFSTDDFDEDGIPNNDLDSDGDGCSDVLGIIPRS